MIEQSLGFLSLFVREGLVLPPRGPPERNDHEEHLSEGKHKRPTSRHPAIAHALLQRPSNLTRHARHCASKKRIGADGGGCTASIAVDEVR